MDLSIDDILTEERLHQLAAVAAAGVAGIAVREVVRIAWSHGRGDETPENPAVDEGSWGDALVFAAISGLLVAVARVAAQRAATAGVQRFLGHEPHGVDTH